MLIPKLLTAWISAPALSSISQASGLPLNDAKCRATKPSPVSFTFTQASSLAYRFYCVDSCASAISKTTFKHCKLSLKVHSCSKVLPFVSTMSQTWTSGCLFRYARNAPCLSSSINLEHSLCTSRSFASVFLAYCSFLMCPSADAYAKLSICTSSWDDSVRACYRAVPPPISISKLTLELAFCYSSTWELAWLGETALPCLKFCFFLR